MQQKYQSINVVCAEGSSVTVALARYHVLADCSQSQPKTQTLCTTLRHQSHHTLPPSTSGLIASS